MHEKKKKQFTRIFSTITTIITICRVLHNTAVYLLVFCRIRHLSVDFCQHRNIYFFCRPDQRHKMYTACLSNPNPLYNPKLRY